MPKPKVGDYRKGWRPEQGSKKDCQEMLAVLFDAKADDQEVDMALTTLLGIVAPQHLEDSIPDELKVALGDMAPPGMKMPSKKGLKGLILALKILSKYGNPDYPTHCEHDTLLVNIPPDTVEDEDKKILAELGFKPNDEFCFISTRYGSA